ncbi:MAG TPA: ATP-binding protein, partial [Chitinophagaceae bacterium]|nr:ATP-binding protein [Chitinophagaceae bacterium]
MEEATTINGIKPAQVKDVEQLTKENSELKRQLDELSKEMNQFTYIVSHDLQAPLRTITGFMELLVNKYGDKLDDKAKQFIDYAVKGTSKMKNLIFDLLEYSRLNTSIKEKETIDLNEIMREVLEKYQAITENQEVVIHPAILPVVNASKKQMLQLIGHLVGNALKFRSDTKPEINISSQRDNDDWIICVKDNGIGIDSAFFEKIFIVFRRLYSDETKYPGTGIGLALCKKIAELHGG